MLGNEPAGYNNVLLYMATGTTVESMRITGEKSSLLCLPSVSSPPATYGMHCASPCPLPIIHLIMWSTEHTYRSSARIFMQCIQACVHVRLILGQRSCACSKFQLSYFYLCFTKATLRSSTMVSVRSATAPTAIVHCSFRITRSMPCCISRFMPSAPCNPSV